MPAEVFLDTLELECPSIQTVPFHTPLSREAKSSYPLPMLGVENEVKASVSVRTAVLKNDSLEAHVALSLGGRLLALKDLRSNQWILPLPSELPAAKGGRRGVEVPIGIELVVGDAPRLCSLAPVDYQISEPAEADQPADLLLHELVPGNELSWHARWSLDADRSILRFDFRVLRRDIGLEQVMDMPLGLLAHGADAYSKGFRWLATGHQLGVVCEPHTFDTAENNLMLRQSKLHPRQSDSFSVSLIPVANTAGELDFCESCAVHATSEAVEFFPTSAVENGKLLVRTEDGQLFETPIALDPASNLKIDLTSLSSPWKQLILRDAAKTDLWQTPKLSQAEGPYIHLRSGSTKSAACIHFAHRALVEKKWAIADRWLDEATLHQGDDPLTWWLRSVIQRHSDPDRAERSELLNCHFLAPLEPLVRAETFLNQPITATGEGPSLLAPLTNHPDAQLEIVARYIEAHLFEDTARLLDELIRLKEVGMLRILQSWMLLKISGHELDAAEALRRAEDLPLEPPFPWRPVERRAIRELLDAIDHSVRLKTLQNLVD